MNKCIYCFNDLFYKVDLFHYFHFNDVVCGDCRRKIKKKNHTFYIENLKVTTLYEYNDFMESILFQFKEGKDIALKDLFLIEYKKYIETKYKEYTIVYIPSSEEKIKERGFFPLAEIFNTINLNKVNILKKKQDYKQTLQTYENRKKMLTNIYVSKKIKGKILLVDDVITSGSTLLGAYACFKSNEVEALVLCDNYTHVELCDEKKFSLKDLMHILKKK